MTKYFASDTYMKEVKEMGKKEYEQIILSKEKLVSEFRQKRNSDTTAVAVGSAVVALVFLILGLNNPENSSICILLSICCMVAFVFTQFVKRQREQENASYVEAVRNGEMFLIQNQVTGKESSNTSSGDSPAASAKYMLFFHKTPNEGRRSIEVDRQEYLCASEGDKYYLLYLNGKLVRVFPCYKYSLNTEMKSFLVTDKAVVGSPTVSEYEQYQKLERQVGILAKKQWLKTHKSIPKPDSKSKS